MQKSHLKGSIILLITAIIWGSSFVPQKIAMNYVEPFTFQAVRSLMGAISLLPVILFFDFKNKKTSKEKADKKIIKSTVIAGVLCGLMLTVAANLQQLGMAGGTDSGKAGFITAMYILLVPVFSLILGKKVPIRVWICIVFGCVGLYFLCVTGSMTITLGDFLVMLCAVAFAAHILIVDKFAQSCDGVKISCIQFFTVGIITSIFMFVFESPNITSIIKCIIPLLYSGVLSCGVAYTLQIVGQKFTPPTIASLIMSLESVFAVLTQIVIMRTAPSNRELIGCVIMFVAIVISQLPEKKKQQ